MEGQLIVLQSVFCDKYNLSIFLLQNLEKPSFRHKLYCILQLKRPNDVLGL